MELNFRLFNCDSTYSLDKVQELISKVTEKLSIKANIQQRYFSLPQMNSLCTELNEEGKMAGYAVFVVHAHESRLSLNEENAGIGYAKVYRTLLSLTDGRVLIVIGGDDNYKEEEHSKSFLSKWAWRKICSQFAADDMNGFKSFIFSWDDSHNPIHEEALEFYLNPEIVNQKFERTPKPEPTIIQPEKADENRPDPKQREPLDQSLKQTPPHENEELRVQHSETAKRPKFQDDAHRHRQNRNESITIQQETFQDDAHRQERNESVHQKESQPIQGQANSSTPAEGFEQVSADSCMKKLEPVTHPEKGYLRYRASLVDGKVEKVLYCRPCEWSPDKIDLDAIAKNHANLTKGTLEFWANKPYGPTNPPMVSNQDPENGNSNDSCCHLL